MGISKKAMDLSMPYAWPGNVRELKSAFEYSFVTCQDLIIQSHHFPPALNSTQRFVKNSRKPLAGDPDRKKKQLIEALESVGGNQSRAAEILGVSRVTVWNRMKKMELRRRKKSTPKNGLDTGVLIL